VKRAARLAQERTRLGILLGRLEQTWRIEPSDIQVGRGATRRYVRASAWGRYSILSRELRAVGARGPRS